jgi:hypothetical protein
MPDKRALYPWSVGKTFGLSFRKLAAAGLVAACAACFAPGCTDNSGNGHFVPPGSDGAAGAGGGGGGGGGSGGGGGASAGAGSGGAGGTADAAVD